MSKSTTGIVRGIGLLVSIFIFIVACSRMNNGSGADKGPDSSPTWSVQLSISGGFAGVRQHLEVNQDGRVVAVDEKLGKKVNGKLRPQDLTKIQKLVEWRTATLSSLPEKPRRSGCFDCFVYKVSSTWDGKKIDKQYSGLNLVNDNERQLIQDLSRVLRDQLGSIK